MKIFTVIAVFLALARVATGQVEVGGRVTVVNASPIFVTPTATVPLRVAAIGTTLLVEGVQGAWYQVQFRDPQFGRRIGWIEAKDVKVMLPEPVDLSIRDAQPSQVAQSLPAPPQTQPVGQSVPHPAPSVAPDRTDRGWIDIDFARFQSSQAAQTFTFAGTLSQETSALAAAYPKLPAVSDIGISGGVGFQRGIGIAARFSGANYKSTVGLGISVPSPYFFNNSASDASVTKTALERRERSFSVSAVYTIPSSDRARVRIFGGPTYFHVTNDMVSDIEYQQVASSLIRINVVAITGFAHREVSGSTIGFHTGADAAVFFARHVGVGGGLRFATGTVTVAEPLSEVDGDLNVRQVEAGGGLRLRF